MQLPRRPLEHQSSGLLSLMTQSLVSTDPSRMVTHTLGAPTFSGQNRSCARFWSGGENSIGHATYPPPGGQRHSADGPLRTFNRATAAAARRHRSCLPSSPQHFQRPEVCRGGQGRRGWPSGLWDGLRRSRRGRPFVCVCRPPGRHSDQRICAQTKRIISVEASGPAGSA